MTRQNLHAHTVYDDGRDTPRAMIEAALAAGFASAGLSLHSPLPFENEWAAKREDAGAFLRELRALREEFAGRIGVYAGIEWDALSPRTFEGVDYVIGSVHHLCAGGEVYPVDKDAETLRACVEQGFGGDADEAARQYFAQVGALADVAEVDIVGHFDLITKFRERDPLFDEESAAYRGAAADALSRVCAAGKIVEINTGAISRGHRATPYPARRWLEALARMGGRVTISSDAHSARDIACAFERAERLAKDCGFKEIWILEEKEFVPVGL